MYTAVVLTSIVNEDNRRKVFLPGLSSHKSPYDVVPSDTATDTYEVDLDTRGQFNDTPAPRVTDAVRGIPQNLHEKRRELEADHVTVVHCRQ